MLLTTFRSRRPHDQAAFPISYLLRLLLLLCLHGDVQAKNIPGLQKVSQFEGQNGSVLKNGQQGHETGSKPLRTEFGIQALNHIGQIDDSGDSSEEDIAVDGGSNSPWYDDVEYGDDFNDCTYDNYEYNPLCRSYAKETSYDGYRDGVDSSGEVDKRRLRNSKRRLRFHKRRLRFHKRRLRFIKKRQPENFYSTRFSIEDEYPRNSRAPRLRFVKREVQKREVGQASQAGRGETADVKNPAQVGHSRKKRSLSISQDMRVLANMVIGNAQRRIQREREELTARLLAAGKRSVPSLKVSDMTDSVLSRAFDDVLKSIMDDSRYE